MGLKKCPECGFKIDESRKQCPNCGNRDFDKEVVYNKKLDQEIIIHDNNYENPIASKLHNWANALFVTSIIIGIILMVIYFVSLENVITEYERISNNSNLYYGLLFIVVAPIEKLLINSKSEELELLYRINKNTQKRS